MIKEERPWGCYVILDHQPGFKIKKITINPNSKLSLQKHNHREEIWIPLRGKLLVTIDDRCIIPDSGKSIFIPKGTIHRAVNNTLSPVTFIEIQRGRYLEEDDIVRYEDDYGRISNHQSCE